MCAGKRRAGWAGLGALTRSGWDCGPGVCTVDQDTRPSSPHQHCDQGHPTWSPQERPSAGQEPQREGEAVDGQAAPTRCDGGTVGRGLRAGTLSGGGRTSKGRQMAASNGPGAGQESRQKNGLATTQPRLGAGSFGPPPGVSYRARSAQAQCPGSSALPTKTLLGEGQTEAPHRTPRAAAGENYVSTCRTASPPSTGVVQMTLTQRPKTHTAACASQPPGLFEQGSFWGAVGSSPSSWGVKRKLGEQRSCRERCQGESPCWEGGEHRERQAERSSCLRAPGCSCV